MEKCNIEIEKIKNGFLVRVFHDEDQEEASYYKTIGEVNNFVLGMIKLFNEEELIQ